MVITVCSYYLSDFIPTTWRIFRGLSTAIWAKETVVLGGFFPTLSPELASEISTILMNDERHNLHKWESKQIYPKEKSHSIGQLVTETILSLRCFLIDQKVDEFKQDTVEKTDSSRSILEEVKNYSSLKMLLSRKLNRVI